MFAGLIDPDGGHIEINGRTIFNSEADINIKIEQRRIGYVFQESRLFPHMTVYENIQFWKNLFSSTSIFDFIKYLHTFIYDINFK